MHNIKLKKGSLLLLSSGLLLLVGCSSNGGSGGGSNGGNNGDVSSLLLIPPKVAYSLPESSTSSYVVINNPTNVTVKNLHYSLSNPVGSGSSITIDEASAAECATVMAHSQCNIKIKVPAGAVAGSFGFSLNNDNSLLGKLSKSVKSSSSVTVPIGVEQAKYNSLSGADGVTLSYYHTVINGTPYVLVSGLVASANAGTFNNIVLVDSKGNAIPGQSLIGSNSGYTQGATFQILLPVPAGSEISQTIKVQTQQISDGQTTVVSTATTSSTLTTKENIGIAEMLPSAVYLSSTNPEQTITFVNIGDVNAQLQQLVANNPNIEVVFNPSSLNTGETTTAILRTCLES